MAFLFAKGITLRQAQGTFKNPFCEERTKRLQRKARSAPADLPK